MMNLSPRLLIIGLLTISLVWSGCAVSAGQEFNAYPSQIRAGTGRPEVVYVRSPDYYAVHYGPEDRLENGPEAGPEAGSEAATPRSAGAVTTLEDGTIAIFAGNPAAPTQRAATPAGATITPVYALQPGGTLAVPTGQVFVRFAEGTSAESQQDALRRAGYAIVDSPPYAPHTAWVRPQSGQVADALTGLTQLEAIPAVENVEPQLLMQRRHR